MYVIIFVMYNFWLKLSKTAQMTDGPTFTNESWKLGSGGSKSMNTYDLLVRSEHKVGFSVLKSADPLFPDSMIIFLPLHFTSLIKRLNRL